MSGMGDRSSALIQEIERFRGTESDANEEERKGMGRGGGESPVGWRTRGRRGVGLITVPL